LLWFTNGAKSSLSGAEDEDTDAITRLGLEPSLREAKNIISPRIKRARMTSPIIIGMEEAQNSLEDVCLSSSDVSRVIDVVPEPGVVPVSEGSPPRTFSAPGGDVWSPAETEDSAVPEGDAVLSGV
jgi:hypothetical protein